MGNQQESDMELSRRCDSGQAMVRRRPAIRTRLEGQTFPPGFQQALEPSLSRPVARLEGQTDLGRLRLRKEFRGAGKATWRVRLKRQGFRRAPLKLFFAVFCRLINPDQAN